MDVGVHFFNNLPHVCVLWRKSRLKKELQAFPLTKPSYSKNEFFLQQPETSFNMKLCYYLLCTILFY